MGRHEKVICKICFWEAKQPVFLSAKNVINVFCSVKIHENVQKAGTNGKNSFVRKNLSKNDLITFYILKYYLNS